MKIWIIEGTVAMTTKEAMHPLIVAVFKAAEMRALLRLNQWVLRQHTDVQVCHHIGFRIIKWFCHCYL